MKEHRLTHFLNVDLDLYVAEGMDELLKALQPAIVISRDGTRATLEVDLQPDSPEDALRRFVKLVDKLSPNKRAIWNKAIAREFNIGVQAGKHPHSMQFTLSNEAVALANSLSASVAFTVYGVIE